MRQLGRYLLALAAPAIVCAVLIDCASNDLMDPGLDTDQQTDVASATRAVAIAGPSAATAEAMIVGLMSQVTPTRAPGDPDCPATFDLGNGITGTCTAGADTATFTFGGTVAVDGVTVTVDGSLSITATFNQPATGGTYSIAYDASVSGPRGDGTWSATGTVTVDEAGNVVDIDFVMALTFTPTGGATTTVTAIVDATRFELLVNGPLGGTLVFQLDRTTMTGEVLLNGLHVADVMIDNGCATIRYTVPGVPDRTVCSNS